MREFLVTKFVCAKCGHNLHLSYNYPKGNEQYSQGEPTGADMVRQTVAIEPCECCMRPLTEILKAAKTFLGNN